MLALQLLFWTAWAVVAYTYLVFPALLALFARLFGHPSRLDQQATSEPSIPSVALVVAAYNEAAVIDQKLSNTWALDYSPDRLKLVIGSDGSSDGTNALLEACTDPRLECCLFPQRRGKISVLN